MYQRPSYHAITGEGITFGHVLGNEFIIWRKQNQVYRSCPCQIHKGFCLGFTLRIDKADEAVKIGAKVLKVNLTGSGKTETYVSNLNRFMASATTLDNKKILQYSMPIHDFVKVEK